MQQAAQTQPHEVRTESIHIPGTDLRVARVALGVVPHTPALYGTTRRLRSGICQLNPVLPFGAIPVFDICNDFVNQTVNIPACEALSP